MNSLIWAENHFYEYIRSAQQRGTQFHIKQSCLTPLKGEHVVIYKDFEGALSSKNESHYSI